MDDATRSVREFSKAVFGSAGRLDLLATLAGFRRPFMADEFAKEAGVGTSVAYQELARLRSAGLLTRTRGTNDRAYVYQRRGDTVMWTLAWSLRDEARKRASEQLTAGVVSELSEMARLLAGAVA